MARSRSAETEARDVERDLAKVPRARVVSDRIQQLLDALPYPPTDAEIAKRRERIEGYALAVSYTIAWGKDISQEEYDEWMRLLADEDLQVVTDEPVTA